MYFRIKKVASSNPDVEFAVAANVVISGKVCPLRTRTAAIRGGCLNWVE